MNQLKRVRIEAGLSMRQVAEAGGISATTVLRCERQSDEKPLPPETLERFAAAFRSLGVPDHLVNDLVASRENRPGTQPEHTPAFPARSLSREEQEVVREQILRWQDDQDYEAREAVVRRFDFLKRRLIARIKVEARQLIDSSGAITDRDLEAYAQMGIWEAISQSAVFSRASVDEAIEEGILRSVHRSLASRQGSYRSGIDGWHDQIITNTRQFEMVAPSRAGPHPIIVYATTVHQSQSRIDCGAPLEWHKRPPALRKALSIYGIRASAELGPQFHCVGERLLLDAGFRKPERLIDQEALVSWEGDSKLVQSACAILVAVENGQLTARFREGVRTLSRTRARVHRILRAEDLWGD